MLLKNETVKHLFELGKVIIGTRKYNIYYTFVLNNVACKNKVISYQ